MEIKNSKKIMVIQDTTTPPKEVLRAGERYKRKQSRMNAPQRLAKIVILILLVS